MHASLLRELGSYGTPAASAVGPLALHWVRVDGRGLDDYLNINMRQETPVVPVLSVDGALTMSLTWMRLYHPITDASFRERVFAALGQPRSPASAT